MKSRSVLGWSVLPRVARIYVCAVIAIGASLFVVFFPRTFSRPTLFAVLALASCLTSVWKVNLPIPVASGSTLSLSYAADLMSLLLLGPRLAMLVALAGVWAQCTFKVREPYPWYRTAFSLAAEAITMSATGAVYIALGGVTAPVDVVELARPLVGAIITYFVVNTGLVAGAVGLSTGRSVWTVWRDDFSWSGASFMVAGTAGAIAAVVIGRGSEWLALLTLAPVYLTYRTYQIFAGRLELMERERAARASAEQANRLKDQFLAIVSHELRTPLNAILGWADLLRRGVVDESRRDRALQAIYDSARYQAQLIDELLDVSRIMSGKLRLEHGAADVHDIVSGALEMVQPLADAQRIQIVVDAHPGSGVVAGDAARLRQIVWNLLTNAVKFTPAGGVIHVGVRPAGETAEIAVTDTGRGISQDFLPFVFEPFRQADSSAARQHGGLGLGLSIVKHLVEAHGGTVTAESGGEGFGSTFRVRLPVLAAPPMTRTTAGGQTPASDPEDAEALEDLSVLVVDDDEQSRAIVAEYLRRHGARVVPAESASKAFELLQREQVDVLLADIAMPGEDGYTLIRKIRAWPASAIASVPAAALTSFTRDEDRQLALQAGFQMHLAKPVDPASLIDAVATLGKVQPA